MKLHNIVIAASLSVTILAVMASIGLYENTASLQWSNDTLWLDWNAERNLFKECKHENPQSH